jgi:hypothetical protein
VALHGRTPWTGDQPVARLPPTQRTTRTQNKRTQTSMPRVGFESTIPVFERVRTVHASDRAVTVIGWSNVMQRTVSVDMKRSFSICCCLTDSSIQQPVAASMFVSSYNARASNFLRIRFDRKLYQRYWSSVHHFEAAYIHCLKEYPAYCTEDFGFG